MIPIKCQEEKVKMRYALRVVPRAKQNKVVEEEGRFKVFLTDPPVEGQANKALIEVLAGYLGVRKSRVRIIRGEKSRDKVVEVEEKEGAGCRG
jgi:uncharacterized protein